MSEYRYLYKYGPSPSSPVQQERVKEKRPCRCGSKNRALEVRQTRYVETNHMDDHRCRCRCGSKNRAMEVRQTRYMETNHRDDHPCDEQDVT
jgi:hypothetical protein